MINLLMGSVLNTIFYHSIVDLIIVFAAENKTKGAFIVLSLVCGILCLVAFFIRIIMVRKLPKYNRYGEEGGEDGNEEDTPLANEDQYPNKSETLLFSKARKTE
jgi:phosphotransferase system  glucose/maltose/N-acetylglucosamine-specific IIC component